MQANHIIVRFGELTTKGKNRKTFTRKLLKNTKEILKPFDKLTYELTYDHIFILLNGEDPQAVAEKLKTVFGIHSFSLCYKVEHDLEAVKEAAIDVNGTVVKVAVTSGMANAKKLLDQIKDGTSPYAFIEIMCCPGGCINGGGQPYVRECFLPNEDDDIMDTYKEKRAQALYSEDERQTLRQSHKNPQIVDLYEKFLGEPNSHKAHELLHTTYEAREGFNEVK